MAEKSVHLKDESKEVNKVKQNNKIKGKKKL
jgi:hypothetical protein